MALHGQSHSFWLPLTVAVVVRPEYASIFVRTVNRLCGTAIGAVCAAALLALSPSGGVVAVGAASALAFAVLTAPKLYAFNVIGVTASALLSSCIGSTDDVLPLLRLVDTFLGAAIAIVVGHLLWPHARRFSERERIQQAVDAARAYLDLAETGSSTTLQQPTDLDIARIQRQLTEIESTTIGSGEGDAA